VLQPAPTMPRCVWTHALTFRSRNRVCRCNATQLRRFVFCLQYERILPILQARVNQD
jgi:hypothetical protein